MKRFLSFVFVITMILSFASCSDNSTKKTDNGTNTVDQTSGKLNTAVWDGSVADSFSKGSGTEDDPYIIRRASELAFIAKSCSEGHNFSGQYLELGCNIDLNGKEWDPIGIYTSHHLKNVKVYCNFEGSFDGKGYTVSNFKMTKYKESTNTEGVYYGLFGATYNATICNLTVKDYTVDLKSDHITVGGLVAICVDNCHIENCHSVTGDITVSLVENSAIVGGLIGYYSCDSMNPGFAFISNCSAHNNVKLNCLTNERKKYYNSSTGERVIDGHGRYNVGGFAGLLSSKNSVIFNCTASGGIRINVDAENDEWKPLQDCAAGGFTASSGGFSIKNCYSATDIIVNKDFGLDEIGGFIGVFSGQVSNCYSTGNITLTYPKHYVYLGGFMGHCSRNSEVRNCFIDSVMDWSLFDDNGDFFIGNHDDYLKNVVDNCYVSENSAIKDKRAESDTNIYKVTAVKKLKDKSFLQNSMSFEEYDKDLTDDPLAVAEYPGWVFPDNSYPVLFFEKKLPKRESYKIEAKNTPVNKEVIRFIGKTSSEVIKEYGDGYAISGNNLSYSKKGIIFVMSDSPKTITGKELITGIFVHGDFDIGYMLNANMTYNDIKAIANTGEKPDYLEIDGSYSLSVTKGKYIYSFSWSSEDYNDTPCDEVYITTR